MVGQLRGGPSGATRTAAASPGAARHGAARHGAARHGAARRQRGRVRAVPARTFAGQQVGVDGLLQQGVPERVPLPLGPEHLGPHRLTQRLVQGRPVQAAHGEQQLVCDPAATDGGQARDVAGRVAQPLQPVQQHLREPVGHARAVPGREQLLGEVRVALGARHAPGGRWRQAPVPRRARPRKSVIPAWSNGSTWHPADVGQAGQVAQQSTDRVGSVEVVAAVAGHDQHPLTPHPAEEVAEQVSARTGPPSGGPPARAAPVPARPATRRGAPPARTAASGRPRPPRTRPRRRARTPRGPRRRGPFGTGGRADVRSGRPPSAPAGWPTPAARGGRARQVAAERLGEREVRQSRGTEVHAVPAQDGGVLGCGLRRRRPGAPGSCRPRRPRPGGLHPADPRAPCRTPRPGRPARAPAAHQRRVDAQPGHEVMVAAATDVRRGILRPSLRWPPRRGGRSGRQGEVVGLVRSAAAQPTRHQPTGRRAPATSAARRSRR